jgi:NAD(P)-dependent dehydrogenase (short-subunit alcohol dehydrogenase family)
VRAARAGRIVMISSGLASLTRHADPNDGLSAFPALGYAASKSAMNAVMMGFANELRGTAIRVNAVNPGFVATDINGHRGTRSVAQGAFKAVELATMGDDCPTASFLNDTGPEPW